jgi:acetyl-CoA carboxylase biotin carboxylase subunit
MSEIQKMNPISKILIANRGEIALRILRACQELGLKTVAVHSTADAEAMHVRLADESVCIGPASGLQSYLNIPSILAAAEVTNADAIHPGFGFLSENADFAEMVTAHGLTFIGPKAELIRTMGQKVIAKQTAVALGLSVISGSEGEINSLDDACAIASSIGYPVLLKATAGGGGKGMRIVRTQEEMTQLLPQAQGEALASFGNGSMYMEKFLERPRHIEFQVLGDLHGNVVCLGDRECSVQRNHQKIWEEAPSPILSNQERTRMIEQVIGSMKKFNYTSLGTLEFLYENGQFYFIEMNTRVQVEHPVTEMITGIDLVKEQIRVAQGHRLSFSQEDIALRGHAIECRINAENSKTFCPSPGRIVEYLPPGGPFVRVDSALFAGYRVPPYYDSLISKLIVHGRDREECLARLRHALNEYVITGIDTLIPLHQQLSCHPDIIKANYHVKWLENEFLNAPTV